MNNLIQKEIIIKKEPLITRLNYSPSRSIFIRNLESLLQTRAANGQRGKYYENNMSTIRFRFMSMTAIIMEESREYNNFNLMVDFGSTLGLYFGLTILTIFELIIFILYRSASHNPAEIQKPPPESIIYNIPIKNNNINKKELRQRKKTKNYVIAIIN
uniref:Neur_chan_memb domain-containing protein n=1 Tax=Meloidogyne hapla TaxID=6305 RepID=A0A1I8AYQ9_MELHA